MNKNSIKFTLILRCTGYSILTMVTGSSLFSVLSNRSSDKEYLASPVTASTGPFTTWNFIAWYNKYKEEPVDS